MHSLAIGHVDLVILTFDLLTVAVLTMWCMMVTTLLSSLKTVSGE